MDTATISYRVADFLKKYPPFNAIADQDLIEIAAHGRVRFHEPNEYILWQGEPHRHQVFVIQQGTVSLWDEAGELAELRDVRGAGDMLGLERFNDAPKALYSARSESDVVIYALPADEFDALLEKYSRAREYVAAEGRISVDYHATGERRNPGTTFLHQLVAHKTPVRCGPDTSIQEAARKFIEGGSELLAVVDDHQRPLAILTASSFVDWAARSVIDASARVGALATPPPLVVGPNATLTDGVLAMGAAHASALIITDDGTRRGRLSAVLSTKDLSAAFGEQPVTLLEEIRNAADTQALRSLNHRVRAFTLQHLTSAASVDWLSEFTHLADAACARQLVALAGGSSLGASWCFCGSSGRAESLTRLAPQIMLIVEDGEDQALAVELYNRVLGLLGECDYLPRPAQPFAAEFYVASLAEWTHRFSGWIRDPVLSEMYRARRLFDLRPILGRESLWKRIETLVAGLVDTNFLHIIANDCLATLPPLTFFEDAVVDKFGEQTSVFHLEDSALRPLVDVGRVFALAARAAIGQSTLDRFGTARLLLPDQQALFREAADTFRVVLWQQGRIGISEGTSGIDLPPSLLSRHDRHILKSGFRSILRLLQFTANPAWIATL
ncbi:MAG: putative nucleotidyltransferase substrate binding domain-containing protein [Vicinamibacterales bacterium]